MKAFPFFDHRAPGPSVERVRHELKLRSLRVERIDRLTPAMVRITFLGEELSDFVSLAPDDHVKIFVPMPSGESVRRDYTPRRYDARARTLVIDFAVHDAGPATRWALDAHPGDTLSIRGPKGSAVIGPEVRRWLLIGDETALPAIGRRVEEAEKGTQITTIVSVAGPEEHQTFETAADLTTLWAHRPLPAGNDPSALLAMVETIVLEPETFVWIAAEADVARAVRAYLLEKRGHARSWLKAGGYWVAGKADTHERLE